MSGRASRSRERKLYRAIRPNLLPSRMGIDDESDQVN
jgi:hypothetical protein